MTPELIVSIIAVVVSLGSAGIAGIALFLSSAANKAAHALEEGRAATELRTTTENAKERHVDRGIALGPVLGSVPTTPEAHAEYERAKQAMKVAEESVLNAYENACSQYLAGKIDKEQFRKDWKREIQNLVRGDEYGDELSKAGTAYKDILKCYNEWDSK